MLWHAYIAQASTLIKRLADSSAVSHIDLQHPLISAVLTYAQYGFITYALC
jgi:hypothetical protein